MAVPNETQNEAYFLALATAGKRKGLEYLINTYQHLAYTLAFKILRNQEDAEEVVQDAFMKAFKSLSSFKKAAKFSTWLYRIVYHTALSKSYRKKMQTTLIDVEMEQLAALAEDNMGWNLLVDNDRKRYVNLALQTLKEEDRTIITLYYIAEKTIAEITEIMDLKKSAIKMRLLRARKQLEMALIHLLDTTHQDL